MPLLACFFVSILFFFRVMQVQLAVQTALYDTGRKMAVYMALDQEKWGETAGTALARVMLLKELDGEENLERYVKGGFAGIALAKSQTKGDKVVLLAEYRMCVPVQLLGKPEIRVVQRASCRKWTGWHPEEDSGSGDSWVYITETGTVYHTAENCKYLTLSITSVSLEELHTLRNESGGKYHECKLCAEKRNTEKHVYITNQGDCFHYDLNCSGIRRTVSRIRLSEVGNRRKCSKCSKTEQGEF